MFDRGLCWRPTWGGGARLHSAGSKSYTAGCAAQQMLCRADACQNAASSSTSRTSSVSLCLTERRDTRRCTLESSLASAPCCPPRAALHAHAALAPLLAAAGRGEASGGGWPSWQGCCAEVQRLLLLMLQAPSTLECPFFLPCPPHTHTHAHTMPLQQCGSHLACCVAA